MVSFEIDGVEYHTVGESYRNDPYVRRTTDKPKSSAQLLAMADFTRASIDTVGTHKRADEKVKEQMTGKSYRPPPTPEEVREELRMMKANMMLRLIEMI